MQLWSAICIYLLVAIIKKKLNIERSIYTIVEVISVSLFEKMPILQAFEEFEKAPTNDVLCKQMKLFEL
jgi:hypothetical protein